MIIKFKNLGPIEKGEIDLNDLKGINLIIGKNNTGKTYLSNLLYCYLKSKFQVTITVFNFLKDFIKEEECILNYEILKQNYEKQLVLEIQKQLPLIFHTNSDFSKNFYIEIDLSEEIENFKNENYESETLITSEKKIIITKKVGNKITFEEKESYFNSEDYLDDIFDGVIRILGDKFTENEKKHIGLNILLSKKLYKRDDAEIYFFPAERSGAILFYNQLLENRNNILRNLELSQDMSLLKNISRYSEPVNEYIIRLNQLEEYENKDETEIYRNLVKDIDIQNIIEGEIIIKSNQIIYKNQEDMELNMGLVSSTVKTLAGFFLYLKYQAQEGDIIFIDEIELNLHPENQRKIIKLINYLSKQGIKFIISTHSPIITEEIDNMLLFEKVKDRINKEEMEEYGLNEEYGLKSSDISVFHLHNKTVEKIKEKGGEFEIETFNSVLEETDNLYQTLLVYAEGNDFGG